MKIRGNTVGTTMPRPDWNQSNPRKADFILNKPDAVLFAAQSLTEAQQDQARINIGAASSFFLGIIRNEVNANSTAISGINLTLDGINDDIAAINDDMGNIGSALDSIIAMQESIIGGESE